MEWLAWLAAALLIPDGMPQALAWLLPRSAIPSRCGDWRRLRSATIMTEGATADRNTPHQSGAAEMVPTISPSRHHPTAESSDDADSGVQVWTPSPSKAVATAVSNWFQARFSVALPLHRGSSDRHRNITNAVANSLAPLLAGVDEGIGLLQVVNRTASLTVGSSPAVHSSAGVAIELQQGNAVWDTGQALWLSLADERGEAPSSPVPVGGSRGSARYDFVVRWAENTSSDGEGCLLEEVGSDSSRQDAVGGNKEEVSTAEGNESESAGEGRGAVGGHVVGELRPLNEFSAERQQALDEALETVGVDVRELTEADEFSGTAALKAYNTFVRPRPKQLSKVVHEPMAKAALRTAHQVAFLVRRHRADRAEYLRNKDASMTEAERKGLAPHPVVLVCDNIRSAYNVGSIFRSADTARAAEVITCGFTPHPGGHGEDKLRKTAFGSVDAVAHRHFEDAVDAVLSLRAAGSFVCALETTEGASSLFDVAFPRPPPSAGKCTRSAAADGGVELRGSAGGRVSVVGRASEDSEGQVDRRLLEGTEAFDLTGSGVVALVLGNEVTGVDERVLTRCDLIIEVPVFGLKNSLNVASAGTVVLYEVLRQWAAADRLAGAKPKIDVGS